MATRTGSRRRTFPWGRVLSWLVGVPLVVALVTALSFAVLRGNPELFVGFSERFMFRHFEPLADDEAFFKYGAIGNEGAEAIPYKIWRVLPEVCKPLLPKGAKGYEAFGFTWETDDTGQRKHELPIGLARATLAPTPFSRVGGVEVLGINCATCHVQTYTLPGETQPTVYVGGSLNRLDAQAYTRFVAACADHSGFETDTLLAAMARAEQKDGKSLSLLDRVMFGYLVIPVTRELIRQQLGARFHWTWSRPHWGPGRLSPFNPVKFAYLRQPVDDTIDHSDVMPAWDVKAKEAIVAARLGRAPGGATYGSSCDGRDSPAGSGGTTPRQPPPPTPYHWDGLSWDLREVVINSALGDGMTRYGFEDATIDRLVAYLCTLEAPRLPQPHRLDPSAPDVQRGAALFADNCASCHAPDGARVMTIIPREEIGTDPSRIRMWTPESAAAYNNYDKGGWRSEAPWWAQAFDRVVDLASGRKPGLPWEFTSFQKHDGYLAQPLTGIWLTGPYLHNGSVPTLDDLLRPPDARPKTFIRGLDAIDLEKGGYVAPPCTPGRYAEAGFCYDTTRPGNGNGGHTWGAGLGDADRRALVRYLLTL